MSAEWVQLPTDTHEHAAGLAEYRLLATECIRDAVKCLDYATAYRPSVERLRDPDLRILHYDQWRHLRSRFYAHRAQLEHDIDWFTAPDGYALWVLATLLDDREAEGVRVEFLRRARPLLAYYHRVHREMRRQMAMNIYQGRCFCVRSTGLQSKYKGERCVNRACNRQAGPKVIELASKAGVPIGWADLQTSRCGFVSAETESQARAAASRE